MDTTEHANLEAVGLWWRAANYLSVGQLYLRDNPLLSRPLDPGDIKARLLGHWGTVPGINLLWAHLNAVITERRARAMFVCGPGHGAAGVIANAWLEGTYTRLYPEVDFSVEGMRRLFAQFSFPGGVPSHAAPQVPGSIHEGGELGYALAHAHGAAFDAPGEVVVCMVGDGEAETGPTATSWHSHRFVDPRRDGAVLPVLHLNGWKIANPTVLARMPESQLEALFVGYGYEPTIVDCADPTAVHAAMADSLDRVFDHISDIAQRARVGAALTDTVWPLLIMRTPKGFTGPASIDGEPVEGHFRSHQVPLGWDLGAERLIEELGYWMRSYRPEELFGPDGRPTAALDAIRPDAELAMSARERTNAGRVSELLELPELEQYAVPAEDLGGTAGAMGRAGRFVADVAALNERNFRLFGPDEVASNRLADVFEVTDRAWSGAITADDVSLAPDGRVMEVLSEHLCQGWLEGYLLTGRHGLFTSYEAFVHIVDSMFNQHAKWIESASEVHWREPIPSLTYLLSSHVWRQDHNGFSHQDPGFLDVVANKRADVVRIHLPPDANTLLAALEGCLRSRDLVNVVVAGKQPEPQYLDLDAARAHCEAGIGTWHWAGTTPEGAAPEVVLGCAGDVPTMEAMATAELLGDLTDVSVRLVNVVDLMTLQSPRNHPHGIDDGEYGGHFPAGVPTLFAFHGYPWLVHRLTYKRPNHDDLHVRGYMERGTTTTPFDMVMRNGLDRFSLASDAIGHLPEPRREGLADAVGELRERARAQSEYVISAGQDLPEIRDWTPSSAPGAGSGR